MIEHMFGYEITILDNKFGFMPRGSTMEAIYFVKETYGKISR